MPGSSTILLWELEKLISLLWSSPFSSVLWWAFVSSWIARPVLKSHDSQPRYQQLLLCFYFLFSYFIKAQVFHNSRQPNPCHLSVMSVATLPPIHSILSHLSQIASWPVLKPLACLPQQALFIIADSKQFSSSVKCSQTLQPPELSSVLASITTALRE